MTNSFFVFVSDRSRSGLAENPFGIVKYDCPANINEAAVFKFWIVGGGPRFIIVHNKFYNSIGGVDWRDVGIVCGWASEKSKSREGRRILL